MAVNSVTLTESWFQSAGVWSSSVDRFQWNGHHAGTPGKGDSGPSLSFSLSYHVQLVPYSGCRVFSREWEPEQLHLCLYFLSCAKQNEVGGEMASAGDKAAWLAVWNQTLRRGLSLGIVFERMLSYVFPTVRSYLRRVELYIINRACWPSSSRCYLCSQMRAVWIQFKTNWNAARGSSQLLGGGARSEAGPSHDLACLLRVWWKFVYDLTKIRDLYLPALKNNNQAIKIIFYLWDLTLRD